MTENRPRALVLTLQWPWPSNSGGRIRTAAIVAALAHDYEVTTLAADHAESGFTEWDAGVTRVLARRASRFSRARDIVEGALFGDHTAARRAQNAGLDLAFHGVVDRHGPGVVVLGPPFFGPFIDAARAVGASVVLDPNERLTHVARRVARAPGVPLPSRLRALLESWSLSRMERREYIRADAIWVASEREVRNFDDVAPPGVVRFVPNPVPHTGEALAGGDVRAVAFMGWYGHQPNESAALELIGETMPAIRAAGGPERLVVIGREPTARMRELAAKVGGIEITGEVPDALALLGEAGLLVLPIRSGGGTRIKVLEAGSLDVPVVSTALGVEGLGYEPEQHYLRAESTAEFARQVVRITKDPGLRGLLTSAAHALVTARFGPDAVLAAVRAGLPAGVDRGET